MSIFNKSSLILLTLILSSCTLNKIDHVHGVSNLKSKIELFKINKTNKNDTFNILGPAPLVDKSENRWTYFEVRETRTKYGKRDIYANNYVEIFFNNRGLIKSMDFYDIKNLKNVKFSEKTTKTLGVNDSFSKNLLSSTRKRLENARKKFDD